jgi:hypothetical protein
MRAVRRRKLFREEAGWRKAKHAGVSVIFMTSAKTFANKKPISWQQKFAERICWRNLLTKTKSADRKFFSHNLLKKSKTADDRKYLEIFAKIKHHKCNMKRVVAADCWRPWHWYLGLVIVIQSFIEKHPPTINGNVL